MSKNTLNLTRENWLYVRIGGLVISACLATMIGIIIICITSPKISSMFHIFLFNTEKMNFVEF